MPWLSQIPYVQELAKELMEERAKERMEELAKERAEEIAKARARDELQTAILDILRAKFIQVPDEVIARIRAIQDVRQLQQLNTHAGICTDLDAFRAQLPS